MSPDEVGLRRFAVDQLLGLADMKGKAAVGGKVFRYFLPRHVQVARIQSRAGTRQHLPSQHR
jgi:hypothetical protein